MRILFLVWVQKMASAKSLEDMLLSSDIDESAVNALVGSLESQLSSSGIQIPRSDIASSSVNSNHIASGTVIDSNSRLTDGQKHGALLGSLLEQGNSLSSKNLSSTHILGLNSVSSPALANAVMVTLAGALPASGYINQVSTTQQALLNSAVIGRHVSNSDIKLVYSPQSTASHFSTAVNSTAANTGVITTTNLPRNNLKVTTLPNGNPNLNVNSTGQSMPIVAVTSGAPVITGPSGAIQQSSGTTLSAIHNLANIASQQPHIIIPSSIQQQHPNLSSQHIGTLNSKNIMSPRVLNREQLDQGLGLKPQIIVKDGHAPISCQDNSIIQSSALDHRHSPSPVRHNNNFQVSSSPSPVITTKPNHLSHTSGQPINVMTQVMTNQNIIPGVQIVNVNPSRIGPQGIPGQKTLAPRVVISNPVRIAPQMIATRPGTPVQVPGQNSITIPPGIVRGALLVKTENGQLQVVNVTPGLPPSSTTTQVPGTTTYRLQSVQPGTANVMRTLAPQHMTVTLPVSSSGIKPMHQSGTPGGMRPLTSQQMTVTLPTSSSAAVKTSLQNSSATSNTVMSTILQQSSPVMALTSPVIAPRNSSPLQAPSQNATVKMSPNTVKKKCKNFLSTLIRLASDQPDQVATNVKNLIQGLIDGNVQPEDFTTQLQKELNSSPQPCLIPFLKKSLPYLRHSLMTKEMTIEGVRAPLPGAATLPSHTTVPLTQVGQLRPTFTQSSTTLRMVSSVAGSALTAQLSQPPGAAILAHQRLITPRVPPTVVPQSKTNLVIATTTPTPVKSTVSITNAKIAVVSTTPGGALHSKFTPSKSTSPSGKEREKRNFTAVSRDEDDINDVAAMGGVNLVEESQRILASNSELIGTQIRSCKDENFVFSGPLQKRISKIATSYGLEEVTDDVVALVSHAAQMRLKALVEKLGIVAEHRMENIKTESRYEVSQDPKSQIKFLEELDKLEKKRHEEQEREILLRAAKSRSKLEDPEQLKLKQKAKEMQRAEIEEMRQREANMTALLAIGPRKKLKAESSGCGLNQLGLSALSSGSNSVTKPQMRPRVKRVNLRDLLFLMEQERDTVRKPLLYKSYVK